LTKKENLFIIISIKYLCVEGKEYLVSFLSERGCPAEMPLEDTNEAVPEL